MAGEPGGVGGPPPAGSARRRLSTSWPARGAILGLALTAALGLPALLPDLRLLENHLADLRVALLSPEAPERTDVIVVGVTEETLARMPYRSPIDRGMLAGWLEELVTGGARALVFDVLFDQATEPDKDRRFQRALAEAGVPVVVAWQATGGSGGLTAAQAAFQESYLPASVVRGRNGLLRDDVGTVRWLPGPAEPAAPGEPRLALAAAAAEALGVTAPAQRLEIAYRGSARQRSGGLRVYPAHNVELLPLLDPEWARGSVAIVGADLPWTDRHRTPFSAAGGDAATMPGAFIHAHALAQILDGRAAPRAGLALRLGVAAALALAGLLFALLDRPWPLKIGLALLAVALYWVAGFLLYQRAGLLIEILMPTVGMAAAFALAGTHAGRRHLLQKRAIRDAFGHFVAPAVVRQLEAEPERLQLGGESRELTYVFTDIAGFTTLSERIDPQELVRLLNEYLDEMTGIVLAHEGTIDKFIGDAVVCLFNAPEPQPDHAVRAVRCALELDRRAVEFSRRQTERGRTLGGTRIGVHTGRAVIGNFGGRRRFDYTAIGDMVNTASRLEGANKYLGTRVCVSGATVRQCGDELAFRPIGDLVLRGRSEALPVFQPVADGEPEALAAYAAAYELLEADDGRAAPAFRALHDRNPRDPLAALHLRRLEAGERGTRIVLKGK